MKYNDKIESNYLLVEDLVLNKNIFDNSASNYVILKDI